MIGHRAWQYSLTFTQTERQTSICHLSLELLGVSEIKQTVLTGTLNLSQLKTSIPILKFISKFHLKSSIHTNLIIGSRHMQRGVAASILLIHVGAVEYQLLDLLYPPSLARLQDTECMEHLKTSLLNSGKCVKLSPPAAIITKLTNSRLTYLIKISTNVSHKTLGTDTATLQLTENMSTRQHQQSASSNNRVEHQTQQVEICLFGYSVVEVCNVMIVLRVNLNLRCGQSLGVLESHRMVK